MRRGIAILYVLALAACRAPAAEEHPPRRNEMVELPLPSGPPLAQHKGPETPLAKGERRIADATAEK